MGRGDSSWQDRHPKKPSSSKKKPSSPLGGLIKDMISAAINGATTPTVGGSVGTEGYDDTKATTATSKKRESSLKVNISGAGGTGRNIV